MERRHKVAICVYDGLSMLEFGAAYEIFISYGRGADNWYDAKIITVDNSQITLSNGLVINVDSGLEVLPDVDTIILPGWSDIHKLPNLRFLKALQLANASGKRIVSFCSGAFVLASAGILDGKKATTHWRYAEQFKLKFPNIELLVNQLYVNCDNLYTSAGSAACIDLSIELIRQDFGIIQANKTAKRLVVPGNRAGGQLQYIELPVPKRVSDFAKVMDWALTNLEKNITTELLAEKACLSRRTFDRRFKRVYGMSLRTWLLNARVEKAKYLLETTELTIEFVASESGFATSLSLRNHFDKYVGVSPGQYRRALSSERSNQAKVKDRLSTQPAQMS